MLESRIGKNCKKSLCFFPQGGKKAFSQLGNMVKFDKFKKYQVNHHIRVKNGKRYNFLERGKDGN